MDHQVKKETLYVHLITFYKSFEITVTFEMSFRFSYIYLRHMYFLFKQGDVGIEGDIGGPGPPGLSVSLQFTLHE